MSRFRRLIHSVASGYALLAVTTVYALASVPLALHYLSKKQFALWALMSTIGNYLNLVDLGMSGSVARLLIDHKDDRDRGMYGSLIKTGWLVLVAQGAIVFSVGNLLAPTLADLLKIELPLRGEFIALLRWQSTALGFVFAMRLFSHVLTAHQRMDITNYSQMGGLLVNFSVQWHFFHAGEGVFSLVWASFSGAFFNVLVAWWACLQLKLFPAKGAWGRASWRCFREVFDYGKDLFITSVGTQLIWASQTMIITRRLGLEMAAVWAVGTRAFGLVCQLTWRIMTFATPALSEMIVREEKTKLRERFKDIVVFSASFSGFCAVVFASCNSTFVHLLSHGKILWSSQNDLLLGVWMVLLAMLGCHNNLVLARKEIYFLRYIYLMEGLAFVVGAWLVAPIGGLSGIILCSVLCSAVFSYAYGIRRSGGYFGNPIGEIAYVWVLPMFRVVGFFAPVILLTWFTTQSLNDFGRLAILSLVSGTIGIAILLSQGLSLSLQEEIIRRVPSASKSILRRCFRWNCARNETG